MRIRFKKKVDNFLKTVVIIQAMIFCMVYDFEMEALPIVILWLISMLIIILILKKWGRQD